MTAKSILVSEVEVKVRSGYALTSTEANVLLDTVARLKEALAIAQRYLPRVINNTYEDVQEFTRQEARIRELVGDQ